MGTFVKGDVVVLPFPFSDLSAAKRRPAFVVAALTGDDVILCQITSKTIAENELVERGIPRERIVLGFCPERHRQYTGFSVN